MITGFVIGCCLLLSAAAEPPRKYRQQETWSVASPYDTPNIPTNSGSLPVASHGSASVQQVQPPYQQGGFADNGGSYGLNGAQGGYDVNNQGAGMPYNFAWNVNDDYGNDFAHEENSDGQFTRGSYRVLLPDGRTKVVTYTANDQTGFLADVQFQGEANNGGNSYPRQQGQGYSQGPNQGSQGSYRQGQQQGWDNQGAQQRYPQGPQASSQQQGWAVQGGSNKSIRPFRDPE